jgi:hypothetical protein
LILVVSPAVKAMAIDPPGTQFDVNDPVLLETRILDLKLDCLAILQNGDEIIGLMLG